MINRKANSLVGRMSRMRYFYLLLLPVAAYFILFHYKPMYGLVIAFKDYKILSGIMQSPFVGLKHFRRLFDSPMFARVLRNTIIISALRVGFGFPAPILFALLLNEISHVRYKKIVQTISYLPHFISWVVLGGIVREMLSPSRGIVNWIIGLFGVEPIYFMAETELFRGVLIITGIWQSVGWGTVVYLAALASIDAAQYEAATIDGANRFQQVRYITIPSIVPVMVVLLLLNLSHILNAGFDQVFNLYSPVVYEVSDIIDTYVYRVGLMGFDYSFATAVGLFKNLVGFALVIVVNFLTRTFTGHGLW